MATPRTPRRGLGYNQPAAATPSRVYENFRPRSEWKQEKESDVLLIFLPEFLKQNIKVTTEVGNILRVTGERALGANKFSRFQEDFQIPKQCIIKAIRAKFEGGILSITFPSTTTTTTTTTTTVEKPKTSQQLNPKSPLSKKQDNKEPTFRKNEAVIPPVPALPTPILKEPESSRIQTPALPTPVPKEPESSRLQTPSPPKPPHASNVDADLPKKPKKIIESTRPPLVTVDNIPFLPTLVTGKGTIREEVLKGKYDVISETTHKEKGKMHQNDLEKSVGIEEVMDMEVNDNKHNENDENLSRKIVEKRDEEEYRKVMKSLARGVNEEKELVVNMGAAVMVIVGLGAYIYYSFSSSGKSAKN